MPRKAVRRKLNDVEKFYIDHHCLKFTVDEMKEKFSDVDSADVADYYIKRVQASRRTVSDMMQRSKDSGFVGMTNEASTKADSYFRNRRTKKKDTGEEKDIIRF